MNKIKRTDSTVKMNRKIIIIKREVIKENKHYINLFSLNEIIKRCLYLMKIFVKKVTVQYFVLLNEECLIFVLSQ